MSRAAPGPGGLRWRRAPRRGSRARSRRGCRRRGRARPGRGSARAPPPATPASSSFSRRPRLGLARAERADVERLARERALERRDVEALVVVQAGDGRVPVEVQLGQRVLGPRPHDPVGAREPLRRREGRARVDDDRVPADELRGCAERLGRVDGAEDDEPRRRPVHLGIDPRRPRASRQAVPLDRRRRARPAPAARRRASRRCRAGRAAARRACSPSSTVKQDRALLVRDDLRAAARRAPLIEAVHEDVDLAAAGKPDLERLVVGDPVGEEPRLRACEHLARVRRRRRSRRSRPTPSRRARPSPRRRTSSRPAAAPRAASPRPSRPRPSSPRRASARASCGDVAHHAACLRSMPASDGGELLEARHVVARQEAVDRTAAPPASRRRAAGSSGWPLSGLTHTTAKAWRASRAISRPTSAASSRSQPSERITTTAPRVRARRPQSSLKCLERRADPRAARPVDDARRGRVERRARGRATRAPASAGSGACRRRTSRRRGPSRCAACRKSSSAREYVSIEPETSQISDELALALDAGAVRAARAGRRRSRARRAPAAAGRAARRAGSRRRRRERRCGRCGRDLRDQLAGAGELLRGHLGEVLVRAGVSSKLKPPALVVARVGRLLAVGLRPGRDGRERALASLDLPPLLEPDGRARGTTRANARSNVSRSSRRETSVCRSVQ